MTAVSCWLLAVGYWLLRLREIVDLDLDLNLDIDLNLNLDLDLDLDCFVVLSLKDKFVLSVIDDRFVLDAEIVA